MANTPSFTDLYPGLQYHICNLTPEQMLAIPPENYSVIFVPDESYFDIIIRRVRSRLHPDKNLGNEEAASKAMAHFDRMYALAAEAFAKGIWVQFEESTSTPYRMELEHYTLLGDTSKISLKGQLEALPGVGQTIHGLYRTSILFEPTSLDMLEEFRTSVTKLKAAISKHSIEDTHLSPFIQGLPDPLSDLSWKERSLKAGTLVSCAYGEDYIRLKDILKVNGPLDARAVVWIISRLLNVCSLCQFADVPHLDISSTTVFIDPKSHTVRIPVGWWYGSSFGKKPLAAPGRTLAACPDILKNKKFTIVDQLRLVRLLARELLGDSVGVDLSRRKDVPLQMTTWLLSSPMADAYADEQHWGKVKQSLFGGPTWSEMILDKNSLYK